MNPLRPRKIRRLPAVLSAALLVAVLMAVALPANASAHAVLETSDPTRGQNLEVAPEEVTFEFNEPVEASFGALRVFDTEADQVQAGEIFRPEGMGDHGVGVKLTSGLADGTYTATYRVVSADSHPVSGGVVFTVGEGGAAGKTVSELIAESDTGPVTEVGFWLVRWVGFMAIAVAVGTLAFLLGLWSPLLARLRETLEPRAGEAGHRMRLVLMVALVAGLAASLLAIAFQGATAAGTDLWSAFKPDVIREVADTRYGEVMLLRALAWLAMVPLLFGVAGLAGRGAGFAPSGAGRSYPVVLLSLLATAVLVVTPGLAGHATTQDPTWLLFPSDLVHVAAMSAWAGGLAALVWILPVVTRGIGDPAEKTGVLCDFLLRFSGLALVAVVLIAISGTIQAVVEVASIPALVETAFGRAVLIKIVLFIVLIAIGVVNRKRLIPAIVRRRSEGSSPGSAGVGIRRSIRIEVLLVSLVLAVTAALVSYPPPVVALSGPASGSVDAGPDLLEYTVDPARVGSNQIHVYLFDDKTGAPDEIRSLGMSLTLPDADIGPIEADVRKAGPGHYVAPAAPLAVKGDWRITVGVRLSRFNEVPVEFEVPIR